MSKVTLYFDKLIMSLTQVLFKGSEIRGFAIWSRTNFWLGKIFTNLIADCSWIGVTNKSKVKLNYNHDKSLIGGLVVQVGSTMIDTSIKNKLQQIENRMIEA